MVASLISCPKCAQPLAPGQTAWSCAACGTRVEATLGIPSFIPRPDVRALVEAYPTSSYERLLELVGVDFPEHVSADLLARYHEYRQHTEVRGQTFFRSVFERVRREYELGEIRTALVIGSGSGSCLFALANQFETVIGIDPSLEDLILARKVIDERGLGNIILIHGIAQHMPLPDASVDFAIAEDVLEHVQDVEGALRETGRVLTDGGAFAGNSVNRYNLLRPEPHTNVWFLGFVPRRWQDRYAAWRSGFDGYSRAVNLPSYSTLRRSLRHIGRDARVAFPPMEAYRMPPRLDPVFRALERVSPLAVPLLWIFPAHLAMAQRERRR